jgi:hypothetical protein
MLANSITGEKLQEGSGAADVIALIKDQIAAGDYSRARSTHTLYSYTVLITVLIAYSHTVLIRIISLQVTTLAHRSYRLSRKN